MDKNFILRFCIKTTNKQNQTKKQHPINVYDQLSQKPMSSRGRESRDTDIFFRFCIKITNKQKTTKTKQQLQKICLTINKHCHRNLRHREKERKRDRQHFRYFIKLINNKTNCLTIIYYCHRNLRPREEDIHEKQTNF